MLRHPAVPYVAPFLIFLAFLGVAKPLLDPAIEYPLRCAAVLIGMLWLSRGVISLRTSFFWHSVLLGVGVFVIWILPDLLIPGYRQLPIFQNSLTGKATSSLPESLRMVWWFLAVRTFGAVVLVPILEELFWRGFLMRWIIHTEFQTIPLGTYGAAAFWISAALFASEHGSYWDVGLVAGVAYNWWMIRTKSLGDCIVTHAVTNLCLCVYVILTGQWQYWL